MNTLNSQQFKHILNGDSVKNYRSNSIQDLTPQQRLEKLEKKFDIVVYFALALLVALFLTFFAK
ncbi:hypothetical protein [Providencia sp. PROV091]|uniref:hypothetical protein n=1 Tax=Providencia sp. PROV091 TaxID=2949807 RepID=UPI00234B1EB7|nr:hypothetical protein [Providencia sp. PROV091]